MANEKNSLLISDEDRYGPSSPEVALADKPGGKKEHPKTGVSVTLYGPQVDAFCACSLEVGAKGRAIVDFVVKSVSAGDEYGSAVPPEGKNSKPKKVTIVLTDAEATDVEDDGEEGEESAEHEAEETPEAEAAEHSGKGEGMKEAEAAGGKKRKTAISPKEADL